ncbi:MAG: phosphoglycerate kinase [Caulobacteraceae bacterium]
MPLRTLDQAGDLKGKRVLVRVDLNAPMQDGRVSDDTRLRAIAPTVAALREKGAKVILLAHFDRPKGKVVPSMSLKPVAAPLAEVLGASVAFADDCVGAVAEAAIAKLHDGDVLLLENLRFHPGEEKNDPAFADQLAALGDVYVNDAFSAAHRAHASTEALAHRLPAYAGLSMQRELEALEKALGSPVRPVLGIVGGSKVSTKLDLLKNLVAKLDRLAIGGGMANTFLYAQGYEVGASYCEKDLRETAVEIMQLAQANGCELLLPMDVVVSERLEPNAPYFVRERDGVDGDERILDAGPQTVLRLTAAMDSSATLIWNGPLGVFEVPPFDKATVDAARHAAELAKAGKLVAVAGGGDTVSALNHAGVVKDFTFVSTAGGAFLEWMEGKTLPGVAALEH